jgi:hypothetical protein
MKSFKSQFDNEDGGWWQRQGVGMRRRLSRLKCGTVLILLTLSETEKENM